MTTDSSNLSALGAFSADYAIGKITSGTLPELSTLGQVTNSAAELNSGRITIGEDSYEFTSLAQNTEIIYGLNYNPFVRITVMPPPKDFNAFTDFSGFFKGSVLGIRFRKELFQQSSDWVYGVTQYPIPRLDNKRFNLEVNGYGLLFDAPRRYTSRSFRNTTARNIMASIAAKYTLAFEVVGELVDRQVPESDQNGSDLGMLNAMSRILDAFWYVDGKIMKVISRSTIYSRTPDYTLVYGQDFESENSNLNLGYKMPISEFVPVNNPKVLPPGAIGVGLHDIDLDSGTTVKATIRPSITRLGSLSLTSDQFRIDHAVSVNGEVFKPSPELQPFEAGIFMPFITRGSDAERYQSIVENLDVQVRVKLVVPGFPAARPGMVVQVVGVGDAYSGNYFIESIHHKLKDKKAFNTVLTLGRNAFSSGKSRTDFAVNRKPTIPREAGAERQTVEKVEQ